MCRRLGGPPGPVWTGAENLAHTCIRFPDRPAVAIRTELPGPLALNHSVLIEYFAILKFFVVKYGFWELQ